jgi:hypothetical protein
MNPGWKHWRQVLVRGVLLGVLLYVFYLALGMLG